MVAAMVTNLIEAVPEGAYRDTHVTRHLFGREVSMVAHPDFVRAVLTDDESFGHSAVMKRMFKAIAERGVLATEGAKWLHQRRRVTPALRHEAVLALLPTMNEAAEAAASRWLAKCGPTDVSREMSQAALDVILRLLLPEAAAFGGTAFSEALSGYLEQSLWHIGLDLLRLPPWCPYPGRRTSLRMAARCRHLVDAALQEAASKPAEGLMGELRTLLGPEEFVDTVVTFVSAGHETTATALSWALWALSIRPELAAQAAEEAASVGYPIGPEDLPRLRLIRRIVQEVLRLYPPVPVLVRDVRRDCAIDGVPFRRGGTVYLPIYALHRHVSAWEEPDRFDPDRFLPEAVHARNRFAFLPFGAGPRVCMGATLAMTETVVMLAVLLRRVEILKPNMPAPRPVARITLRPAGGVHLAARPRGQTHAVRSPN